MPDAWQGISVVRYAFTVGDSHPLLLAGLPATLGLFCNYEPQMSAARAISVVQYLIVKGVRRSRWSSSCSKNSRVSRPSTANLRNASDNSWSCSPNSGSKRNYGRQQFCSDFVYDGFRFDLALSANSTSWRIASEREGLSGCCFAQFSISNLSARESRIADTGSCPVAGRPRFFRTTGIDFLAIIVLRKSEPVRSANFSPALTQATEVTHGSG